MRHLPFSSTSIPSSVSYRLPLTRDYYEFFMETIHIENVNKNKITKRQRYDKYKAMSI